MKLCFVGGKSHFCNSLIFLPYDLYPKMIYQPILIFVYSPLLKGFRRVYTLKKV